MHTTANMPTMRITRALTAHLQELGFSEKPGVGLLSDAFPTTFTPSVGHHEAIDAIRREPLPTLGNYIHDWCFRAIDLNRVGYGPHLSLFRMSASLRIVAFDRDAWQAEVKNAARFLLQRLGLSADHLYVTTYNGSEVNGTSFPPDEWSAQAWRECGLPPSNTIAAPGRICFLTAGAPDEPAGIRSELYFASPDHDMPFEIGTIEFLRYRSVRSSGKCVLEPLPDERGLFATAYGIERLAMAVGNLRSVFDVPELLLLLNSIVDCAGDRTFFDIDPVPYRILTDSIQAASALIATDQPVDNSRRGQVIRRVIRRLCDTAQQLNLDPERVLGHLIDHGLIAALPSQLRAHLRSRG